MESNWNSFEIRSIQKFAIWLIRKGKKYSKNSMKIDSKFVRFDSNYMVESNFSDAGFVQNLFDSIWKFMIRLIQKVKNNSKNSIKINSKFVRFNSTPPVGCKLVLHHTIHEHCVTFSGSLVNGCCCGAYLTLLQSRRYHYWACKVSGKKELLFAKPCRYVQFLLRTLYFPEKYYVVSRLIFWFLRNIYECF